MRGKKEKDVKDIKNRDITNVDSNNLVNVYINLFYLEFISQCNRYFTNIEDCSIRYIDGKLSPIRYSNHFSGTIFLS
jgi:hypothetical protein